MTTKSSYFQVPLLKPLVNIPSVAAAQARYGADEVVHGELAVSLANALQSCLRQVAKLQGRGGVGGGGPNRHAFPHPGLFLGVGRVNARRAAKPMLT